MQEKKKKTYRYVCFNIFAVDFLICKILRVIFFPYLTPLLLVLGTHRSHKEVHGSFSSCAIVFCKNNICVNCIVDKCDIFMGRENCEEEIKCSVIIMYKSRLLIESNVVWYLINVAFDHTPCPNQALSSIQWTSTFGIKIIEYISLR